MLFSEIGMIYMTNKFLIALCMPLIAGCNAIGSAFTYTEAASFIKGYALGFLMTTYKFLQEMVKSIKQWAYHRM